jgi:hypothetical protein
MRSMVTRALQWRMLWLSFLLYMRISSFDREISLAEADGCLR